MTKIVIGQKLPIDGSLTFMEKSHDKRHFLNDKRAKNWFFCHLLTLKNYFKVLPVLWQKLFSVKSCLLIEAWHSWKKSHDKRHFFNDKRSKNWFFCHFLTVENYFRVLPVLWQKLFLVKSCLFVEAWKSWKKIQINATFSTINGPKTDFFAIFWLLKIILEYFWFGDKNYFWSKVAYW